uniref:Ipi1_N domain-containing protein n=1 Tax=Elaeophora elaphi TaxID=1147741 RepID=A0A0R3RHC5_9BILA
MGKKKKDFPKAKLKVGKKLKKTTATDTRIHSKKVVLVEQLTKSDNDFLSYRGLSLDELCRQLGHYNINVRRDAVVGVKQLFSSHPELLPKHLHLLIPAVGRLIACDKNDSAFHAQLRALLELLCKTNALVMSSHFTLLMAHTLRALTHLRMSVRIYAFKILTLLIETYPNLCRYNIDLFDSFVEVLNSKRIPASNRKLLLDGIHFFLRAFTMDESVTIEPPHVASFSIHSKQYTRINLAPSVKPLIDFCVLGSQPQRSKSALFLPDKFLSVLSGILSLFLMSASEEESLSDERDWRQILVTLNKVLMTIRCTSSQLDQFEQELKKILSGTNSLLKNGNISETIRPLLRLFNLSHYQSVRSH